MATPAPKPSRIPPAEHSGREDLKRKERIRSQLIAGQRVASSDIQPGEFFVQVHRAVLRAINTAHRLTATQRQYLGVLMEYSYGYHSPWAIRDLQDRRPPSLIDWCSWLGGWSSEQVCGVRKQLLDLRVITLVNGDSSYVALNEAWETWDQELFVRHTKHNNVGRKSQGKPDPDIPSAINSRINPEEQSEALIHELTETNQRINVANSRISPNESMNSSALIHGFTSGCSEAPPEAALADALNNRRKEDNNTTIRHSGLRNSSLTPNNVCVNGNKETRSSPFSQAGQSNTNSSQEENNPHPLSRQEITNQPTLPRMGAISVYVATTEKEGDTISSVECSCAEENLESAQPETPQPDEFLYEVWETHAPCLPQSVWEERRLKSGLAKLADPIATKGNPVTPDELPGLMYQHQFWRDRQGHPYALRPSAILNNLGELRRQICSDPAPAVLEWQASLLHSSEAQEAARTWEPTLGDSADETSLDSDPSTVLIDNPAWIAQLSRFVPDAESMREGGQSRDVQMLWGFVRDALRPSLNTARRQHLDSLVPAWNPANPHELLLLASTSYTIRFANMAMRREIDELIGKLLNRFFDRARLVFVCQEVIDHVYTQRLNG